MNETAPAPDRDLIRSYARDGSEGAFRALVGRHVNLVYATAVRQVGDAGLAEEITQNVFVTLARKAPRLAGHETIAGWLHRTALLEAKSRFRTEMRRRRREEVAAALAEVGNPGRDPIEDLTPLLDEALLELRERDRLALVLRFLEERSLREVGAVLGIDEEAARKRVTRALQRVSEFFRRRGFALPGAGSAALLGQAAKAAPAGLAGSVSASGLAAGGTASGLSLVLLHLMTLSKTQTAVVCALLAVAPSLWHSMALGDTRRDLRESRRQLDVLERRAATVDAETARLEAALQQARADAESARAKASELERNRRPRPPADPAPAYRWDDNAPVARVPKDMLSRVGIEGVANRRGELTQEIRQALQLTEMEAQNVQAAIDRFLGGYLRLLADKARPVEPTEQELQGQPPENVRVFEVRGIRESATALHQEFLADIGIVLAPDRARVLLRSLESWMSSPEEIYGLSSAQAIQYQDHRFRLGHPGAAALTGDEPLLLYGLSIPQRGAYFGTLPISELPDFLRPQVQPWIDAAKATSSGVTPPQPTPVP